MKRWAAVNVGPAAKKRNLYGPGHYAMLDLTTTPRAPTLAGIYERFRAGEKGEVQSIYEGPYKLPSRFMVEVKSNIKGIPECKRVISAAAIMSTRGENQVEHTDVSPLLARKYSLYVLFYNGGDDPYTVNVVGKPLTIEPGEGYVIPAEVPHSGTGGAHGYRLAVLFSTLDLPPETVRLIREDAKYLDLTN
jgi:hypothetical protein